ncbi:MAG: methyltransferase FkbM family [Candidatus Nomurabacteria bacterium]|nr:methyltransferase FkbM family [Candidatus Nomurabacteria bacterium]
MTKIIKKIKKAVARRLPENIKGALRPFVRAVIRNGNPAIPAEELKVFDLLKADFKTVFDIGAREDLSFYELKKDCSYYLFEPHTAAIALLKQKIASLEKPDITLNEFGLSDENKDDCVYYEDSQSFAPNPFHKNIDKGQRYSLRPLDGYVEQHGIMHIDFLKIDAEGFDYKIIKGGIYTITTKVDYIQFEYWDGVQKFVDMLSDVFQLYLMMEPQLLEAITEDLFDSLTESQKSKVYTLSVIPLDADLIDLIDRVLIPAGCGGNILGVNKNIPVSHIDAIVFPI